MACSLPDYNGYHQRCVRDLAWAIASPPLLERDDPGLQWPDSDDCRRQLQEDAAWLAALDRDPRPLQDYCERHSGYGRGLGRYFETLLAFRFERDEHYRLLAHNLPVYSAGRTLGAPDFIVRDRATGRVVHIEVAVKFYLAHSPAGGRVEWVGPDPRDRLAIKLQHLIEQQCALTTQPAAQAALRARGISAVDERRVIMKGRLFYPLDAVPAAAIEDPGIAAHHLRGNWCHASSLPRIPGGDHWRWVRLPRLMWLSELKKSDQMPSINNEELGLFFRSQPVFRPQCYAALEGGRERCRLFVVPDSWPQLPPAA